MKNVCEHLSRHAARRGDQLALVEPRGARISFAELHRRTELFAGGLHARGLRFSDAALVLLPMSIPFYVALIGLFRGGYTAVLADPRASRFDQLMQDLPLRALISSPFGQLLRWRVPALRRIPVQICSGFSALPHLSLDSVRAPPPSFEDLPSDVPALVTFTTGTTGTPKPLARSHTFLEAQRRALEEHMGLTADDIDLPTLPVFLLSSLASGATCVLPDANLRNPGRVRPHRVLRQLARWRCTSSSGSPAFFGPIARAVRDAAASLPHLRKVFLGGARVRAQVLEDLLAVAPNARVEVLYGSTEAEPIASIDAREVVEETASQEARGRGNCVGRPVRGVRVRIALPGGDASALPEGQIGEVIVSGDNVSPGYFRAPEADAETKVRAEDGVWHRTGDCGYFDPRGRLWLVGRVKDAVGRLHPFMVEGIAESFSFVERAALVSLDGESTLAVSLRSRPLHWADVLRERTGVDRVVELREVPVDSRHNAKIDRERTRRSVALRLGRYAGRSSARNELTTSSTVSPVVEKVSSARE